MIFRELFYYTPLKQTRIFDALEWLAGMCSHVPNKGEQMVRYYGHYSNASRGKRKKQKKDELIPCILEPDGVSKESRKNWARLIQKIYEVNPLSCPKCSDQMKVISVIEDEDVIKKILKHLDLWDRKARPPPKPSAPQETHEYRIDYSESQLPASDKWLYVDSEYQ
ncbi:MAG: transposase [Deltaproteobacteria bacterium]|nr:transposase [Deltaproteobacteria bacterium]